MREPKERRSVREDHSLFGNVIILDHQCLLVILRIRDRRNFCCGYFVKPPGLGLSHPPPPKEPRPIRLEKTNFVCICFPQACAHKSETLDPGLVMSGLTAISDMCQGS